MALCSAMTFEQTERLAYMTRPGKKVIPSKFRVTVIIEEFQTPELKTVSGSKGFWAELGALLKRLIIACGIQSFWRILWGSLLSGEEATIRSTKAENVQGMVNYN